MTFYFHLKQMGLGQMRMRTAGNQKNNENKNNRLIIIKMTLLFLEIYSRTRCMLGVVQNTQTNSDQIETSEHLFISAPFFTIP